MGELNQVVSKDLAACKTYDDRTKLMKRYLTEMVAATKNRPEGEIGIYEDYWSLRHKVHTLNNLLKAQ